MECERSMRLHASLPLQEDTINIVVYLINRGPSTPLDGGILEETWTGKKVNYSFMKTFVYEPFVCVVKENITKLDAKSQKCTLIGYGIDDYGYWLWDFKNLKIIRSRDVIFNEKVTYKEQLQERKHEQVKEDYVVLDDTP